MGLSKAAIFMVVTLLGAIVIGVFLVLSELLYAEIDELSLCPLWYKTGLFISLLVTILGIVGSAIFKNKNNTYFTELIIEVILFLLGGICLFFAIIENEKFIYDVIICLGGAFMAIAISCGIATAIGYSKNPKIN